MGQPAANVRGAAAKARCLQRLAASFALSWLLAMPLAAAGQSSPRSPPAAQRGKLIKHAKQAKQVLRARKAKRPRTTAKKRPRKPRPRPSGPTRIAQPEPPVSVEPPAPAAEPALVAAPVPRPAQAEPPSPGVLRASRAREPPVVDGVLDEPAWQTATPSATFTQKSPFAGRAPSERTRVRLLYDDSNLYVAFDCEARASPVVALLSRRDRPSETDSVAIAIDSRAQGRSAFEFAGSAAGTRIDGMRYDDGKIAREWDAIWEAEVALRPGGWTAEFRVPLQALRFDASSASEWRFQARRYISARQEHAEWAYIPREAGGEVSHYGRIQGLHIEHSSASLEVVPYVLGRARHQGRDPAITRTGWELRPAAGVDFKWRPADHWALDGTIFPDFGQVEADRVILNLSTVELVFPEKRPFFLAGMDDFATLTPIFHSRRIGRTPKSPSLLGGERPYDRPGPAPIYGALKLAADLGGWTVAALSALTGPNELDVMRPGAGGEARLVDPLTSYSVLRVRAEVAPGLDLGFTGTATYRNEPGFGWPSWLTSNAAYATLPSTPGMAQLQRCPLGEVQPRDRRCFHDAYVGSLDLLWRSSSGEYALRAQGYASAIENGPTRVLADGTRVGSGDIGAGGSVRLSKQGGHWVVDGSFSSHGRKLDFNDLGFMDRQNYLRGGVYLEYRTLDPWFIALETHTAALVYGENNLDGLSLGRGALLLESIVLDNRWTITLGGYVTATRFDDRELGDGTALERSSMVGSVQAISSDPRSPFVLGAQLAEERVRSGGNLAAQLDASWRPSPRAELQLLTTYTLNSGEPRFAGRGTSEDDLVFGRLRAESLGLTLRATYAFTPMLTLQTYAQAFLATGSYSDYAHFSPMAGANRPVVLLSALVPGGPPATPAPFQNASLALNVVLRWEYHLGSTLYLVYVRSQNPNIVLDPTRSPRFDLNVLRTAAASDVLMLKLSYWFG